MKPHITRPELFLIPCDLVTNHNMVEARATYADMEALNLAQLPYPHCIIGVPGHTVFKLTRPDNDKLLDVRINPETNQFTADLPPGTPMEIIEDLDNIMRIYSSFEARFCFRDERCYKILVRSKPLDQWRDMAFICESQKEVSDGISISATQLRILLIVLLATKNIITTRTKDKLVALGIGKNSRNPLRPIYTTTISLPSQVEPSSILIPGSTKRPHLRRGHIRQQKHGPRLSFTRAIWIEPCYINTPDPGAFTSTREAYNTSLPSSHTIPHHP